MDQPIDRSGFDDLHIHDWPIIVYNGIKQTLDMVDDDPRRQEFCPWCRGFGGMRMYAPDVCPGCRGTCLVGVRQQYFLMDRLYARLENIIYPDWPLWAERNVPLLGNKSGQWNNFDPVMSARGRVVEALFDEERQIKYPGRETRVQYPPPDVEIILKQMKISRKLFPDKPVEPIQVISRPIPRSAPVFKPIKYSLKSSKEVKEADLKPHKVKVKVCTNQYGTSYNVYEKCPVGENNGDDEASKNWDKNEKNDVFSQNESNSSGISVENNFSGVFKPEFEPEVSRQDLMNLEKQRCLIEMSLKIKRGERVNLMSELKPDLSHNEVTQQEEKMMKCQKRITELQSDLEKVMEKISNLPNREAREVVQFCHEKCRAVARMSLDEIHFFQTREFVVRKVGDGEFEVKNVDVSVKGENGGKEIVLSADDYVIGMTMAKDGAFFTPDYKVRANGAIKIVANE